MVAAPMDYNPLALGRGQTQIFRAMFLTPFQIPSAAALFFVTRAIWTRLPGTAHPRAAKVVLWMVIAAILFATINGAMRALVPVLTDPHNYPNLLAP